MNDRPNPSRSRPASAGALVVVLTLLAMSSSSSAAIGAGGRYADGTSDQTEAARAVAAVMAVARDMLRPTQNSAYVLRPELTLIGISADRPSVRPVMICKGPSTIDVLGLWVLDLPPPAC